jgi:hypothetical protein
MVGLRFKILAPLSKKKLLAQPKRPILLEIELLVNIVFLETVQPRLIPNSKIDDFLKRNESIPRDHGKRRCLKNLPFALSISLISAASLNIHSAISSGAISAVCGM